MIHEMQCFLCNFGQTRIILNVPLGSTVAFTASICLHLQSLRACPEQRRASARRGEPPLVKGIWKEISDPMIY